MPSTKYQGVSIYWGSDSKLYFIYNQNNQVICRIGGYTDISN